MKYLCVLRRPNPISSLVSIILDYILNSLIESKKNVVFFIEPSSLPDENGFFFIQTGVYAFFIIRLNAPMNTKPLWNSHEAHIAFPHRFYLKSYFFNRKYCDPPRIIFFPCMSKISDIFFARSFVYLAKTIILHAEKNGGLTSLSRQSIKQNHFTEDVS